MKQILWFRRDLRGRDNAVLSGAKGEVLPIFIFDRNILDKLPPEDKRVSFIYNSVLKLKQQLQTQGLDLAVFYDYPVNVFMKLKGGYDEVLCSCDFDDYAVNRDKDIESLLPMKRFYDSYLLHPDEGLKEDGTPYRVFTPFYNNLEYLWGSESLELYGTNRELKLSPFDYEAFPLLTSMGFISKELPSFLAKDPFALLEEFKGKLKDYKINRDYFYKDATSKLSVHLRFGLISPREVFNELGKLEDSQFFIRELFWREFYNYILHHFPKSEFENFNGKVIKWNRDKEHFKAWCEGKTGVPVIDAAMRHLNETGTMHNRLRMITASFLTKNLFLPWQWGESYFAQKLLDYEASSNIGSWQWGASTGADSVPYFRVFNPYIQSEKFDKKGLFIKSVLKELEDADPRLLHKPNGVQSNIFIDYPLPIVDIKSSREEAIKRFKGADS